MYHNKFIISTHFLDGTHDIEYISDIHFKMSNQRKSRGMNISLLLYDT